jgi:hypothetical protein
MGGGLAQTLKLRAEIHRAPRECQRGLNRNAGRRCGFIESTRHAGAILIGG